MIREAKGSEVASSIAKHAAYHHCMSSLAGTIIRMAQDHVGSNNISLFTTSGQFGSLDMVCISLIDIVVVFYKIGTHVHDCCGHRVEKVPLMQASKKALVSQGIWCFTWVLGYMETPSEVRFPFWKWKRVGNEEKRIGNMEKRVGNMFPKNSSLKT